MSSSVWPLPTLPLPLCYLPAADSHLAWYHPFLSRHLIHPHLGREHVQTSVYTQ